VSASIIINHIRYKLVTTLASAPEPELPPTVARTEVKVAVLDSGAGGAYTVPAVTARMLAGYSVYGTPAASSQASSSHQAAITGRILKNSDEYVKLGNINIADSFGNMYPALVPTAITYLIAQGYKVATISYGSAANITAVKTAATTFEAAGGVLIAAVNNDNSTMTGADHEPLLAVAACNVDGSVWASSSQGELVDLCAVAAGDTITTTGADTTCGTSTSYSVGPVAACVAMMLSVNNALTPANVRTILAATCVDLGTAGRDIYAGWGRLDAAAAIEAARTFV
jgi:thermitase